MKEGREEEVGTSRQQNNECGVFKGEVMESEDAQQRALVGEWGGGGASCPRLT